MMASTARQSGVGSGCAYLVLVALTSCTTANGTPASDPLFPREERPESYSKLLTLGSGAPRRGHLRVEGDVLHLELRRGTATRPFIQISRGKFERACWEPMVPYEAPGYEEIHDAAWWIFYNSGEAVALELGARDVAVWYWDADRGCPVRTSLFDSFAFDDSPPPDYYKANDVQIAYLWNYAYHDYVSGTRRVDIDGDTRADLIRSIPGDEELLVEKNLIAIVAPDGRALLREGFEVDPEWPCYNAQLTVFEEPDGGVYAALSFETYGSNQSCDDVSNMTRYGSSIAEWDKEKRRFVTTYQLTDEIQTPTPSSDESRITVQRRLPIAGGALILNSRTRTSHSEENRRICTDRDGGSGVCLVSEECYVWSSIDERTAAWTFLSSDGVTVPVGKATDGYHERVDDCAALAPP